MIEHILVPIEETGVNEGIARYVHELAAHHAARITLLHVVPDMLTAPPADLEAALQSVESLFARLQQESAAARNEVATELRMGDAAEEIIKLGLLERASLVAMATHGRRGVNRLLHGSVAETVLRRAALPLFVTNETSASVTGMAEHGIKRILLPVAGATISDELLHRVIDVATTYGSRVFVYHDERGVTEQDRGLDPAAVQRLLDSYCQRLAAADLTVEPLRTHSTLVPEDILTHIDKLAIDLVAMNTHGRTGLARALYGSVAENVLRRSPCPLLLQRAPRTAASDLAIDEFAAG